MTSRALILQYMRHKRLACSVGEIKAATKRSHATIHGTLSKMEGEGIVRSRKNADGSVIWFLVEISK
jgi:DNA-binding IclR family transcriptional regulator